MEVELPAVRRLSGQAPGCTLALLGGVHGDELEGTIAVRTVVDRLARSRFRGTVAWAAPAYPEAWAAETRVGPIDGVNLARVFPGDPDGGPTQRVAAHLTENLIAGADLLIDLHSAGRGFDMPLLAGYHSLGPLAGRAEAAARAFGAPLLWQHPEATAGRSLSAAEVLGIPSLYVEGRGGGRLRGRDLSAYVEGVLRVMAHLGMVDPRKGVVAAPGPVTVVAGDGNTDEGIRSPAAGWFVTEREAGDLVGAGDRIGVVVDLDGKQRGHVLAPTRGVVMLLRRSARVQAGDTLAIVGETAPAAVGSAGETSVDRDGADR